MFTVFEVKKKSGLLVSLRPRGTEHVCDAPVGRGDVMGLDVL